VKLVGDFLAHAANAPDRAALVTGAGHVITYGKLAQQSAQRAKAYAEFGIGAGDVVLVARGVSPALYATLIALFRLGAVAMFPEPAAGLAGVRTAIAAARPKACAAPGWARFAAPFISGLRDLDFLPEPDQSPIVGDGPLTALGPEAPALVTFTSGSTGRPKGIVRSGGFLELQHTLVEHLRQTKPGDVDLISLPVFILSNLAAGAVSVIPAGNLRQPASLDPLAMRDQIAKFGVTRVAAPPAICARLTEGAPLPQLSRVFTGGGPVFPDLMKDLLKLAPHGQSFAVYGSTEAEPIAHLDLKSITEADWRAMAEGQGLLAGAPIPEITVALVDNEIQVAGPHVNRGYLDANDNARTKLTRGDVLWHRTGDAGQLDMQGRLWLLGRLEGRINGLFPFAVETAALSWPGVRRAALVGMQGRALLALEGDEDRLSDWQKCASRLGAIEAVAIPRIPLDKRHNSKVDYPALQRRLTRI
jgi:acyl-coenzyme A synthetase/AMP-(fatty) acid ligase